MRRSTVIILGIVVAICVIISGSLSYMYMRSSRISTMRYYNQTIHTSSVSLKGIIMKGVNIIEKDTYYVEARNETSIILSYIRIPGNPRISSEHVEYIIHDFKGGIIRNSTMIIYYGYIGNVTLLFSIRSGSFARKVRIYILNDKYMYTINLKRKYIRYCINARVIFRTSLYGRSFTCNTCINISSIPVRMVIVRRNMTLTLLELFLPTLLTNVKYLGERTIGGVRCYLYQFNGVINIAKLISNTRILKAIASIGKLSLRNVTMAVRRIVLLLDLMGLAEWKVSSRFCISPSGMVIYLYSKATNVRKTRYNITMIFISKVSGYRVNVGIVNKRLLEEVESSLSKKVGVMPSAMIYALNIPETALNPVAMLVYQAETSYIVSLGLVSKVTVHRHVKTIPIFIAMNSKALRFFFKNIYRNSIKAVMISIYGPKHVLVTRVSITCSVPIKPGSVLGVTCVKGYGCKAYLVINRVSRPCNVKGAFTGVETGRTYNVTVSLEFVNGTVRRIVSVPIKVTG